MIASSKLRLLFSGFLLACGPPESGDPRASNVREAQGAQVESVVVGTGPLEGFDGHVVQLRPEVFVELPPRVRDALVERGCTIPQAYGVSAEPHNVIRGIFRTLGQEDWAVLCSRDTRSSILIFWSGSSGDVEEIGEADNATFMQVVAPEIIGFSRYISAADPRRIRQAATNYAAPVAFEIHHSGIEDAFVEKASVIHYYREGAWVQLQGAD